MARTNSRPEAAADQGEEQRPPRRHGVAELRAVSSYRIVRAALPRMLVGALGPIGTFYVCLRASGLPLAITLATLVGVGLYLYERRRGRPGLIARVSLAITLLQAGSGYLMQTVFAYFAPARLMDLLIGALCAASVLAGRPVAGPFADEILLLAPEVRRTAGFQRTCRAVTLVWAAFYLGRGAVGLAVLATGRVELYVAVIAVLDAPALATMMGWSIWYAVRSVRTGRPEDWGG